MQRPLPKRQLGSFKNHSLMSIKKNIFIYIYVLTVLDLGCCMQAFLVEGGLLFSAVCRLLVVAASLVAEHRL